VFSYYTEERDRKKNAQEGKRARALLMCF
jgi:hypothetical protein